MISKCLVQTEPGVWRCNNRGLIIRSQHRRIICVCDDSGLFVIHTGTPCPYSRIVAQLSPSGIERLQRCRAARCEEIRRTEAGVAFCGQKALKPCRAAAYWVDFLNGAHDCPRWA